MWVTLSWFFLSDFMESNHLLNWKVFLKQKTMSWMLFYLVCVMISPLQIRFLIKKKIRFLVNSLFQFISTFQQKSEFVKTSWQHRGLSQKSSKKAASSHVCWFFPCSWNLWPYSYTIAFFPFLFFPVTSLQPSLGPLVSSLHLTDHHSMLTSQLLQTRSSSPKWWMKHQPWDLNCCVHFCSD